MLESKTHGVIHKDFFWLKFEDEDPSINFEFVHKKARVWREEREGKMRR